MYGQAAGAIGVLVIVFGLLAVIKEKLGLGWPATALLTAGTLVALGYLAWKIKVTVRRLWAREEQSTVAELKQEKPATAVIGGDEDAARAAAAHPQLTPALVTAGAIGRDQIIRADQVTVEAVPGIGTRWDFLVPEGRTYEDVGKKIGNVAGMFGVTRLHTTLERSRDNERRVKILVLDQPPFTGVFPPPTFQEIKSFDGVPFAHDVTGKLVGVQTFDRASLLVGGMAQTGKTTLVQALITCLLIAYGTEFDLYLLDGKFCGLTIFEKIATRYESSDESPVFESFLDELTDLSDKRYRENMEAIRNRKPPPKFRPVFFIVDEAADFFGHDGTPAGIKNAGMIAEKARKLTAKCLESGISVIMLTQRPANDAIPVKVRSQFLYRICLYVDSEGTAKVALGDTYFETVAPINPVLLDPDIRGQGVLFAHGASTLIRGLYFKDEVIWEVVDGIYDQKQKAIEASPDSALKQAVELMRKNGAQFIPSSELAAELGVSGSTPSLTGTELSKLLGLSSKKGAKGVRGYKLADLQAALMSGS